MSTSHYSFFAARALEYDCSSLVSYFLSARCTSEFFFHELFTKDVIYKDYVNGNHNPNAVFYDMFKYVFHNQGIMFGSDNPDETVTARNYVNRIDKFRELSHKIREQITKIENISNKATNQTLANVTPGNMPDPNVLARARLLSAELAQEAKNLDKMALELHTRLGKCEEYFR